jgi:hypothetical protein
MAAASARAFASAFTATCARPAVATASTSAMSLSESVACSRIATLACVRAGTALPTGHAALSSTSACTIDDTGRPISCIHDSAIARCIGVRLPASAAAYASSTPCQCSAGSVRCSAWAARQSA